MLLKSTIKLDTSNVATNFAKWGLPVTITSYGGFTNDHDGQASCALFSFFLSVALCQSTKRQLLRQLDSQSIYATQLK